MSPARPAERRFDDRELLARELAASLAGDLRRALGARGTAALVVSGGTTPLPLFHALAGQPLPWEAVSVTLADERWVAPGDPASNEGLVRRELLRGRAAAARFVGLVTPEATPEAGWEECERRLAALLRPFDAVVLGMGADGHTASLFPGAPELAAGLDPAAECLCLPVHPPGGGPARMSLTLAALLDSRRICLHLTGEEKWRVYERALAPGEETELPVAALLRRAAGRLEVWWAP